MDFVVVVVFGIHFDEGYWSLCGISVQWVVDFSMYTPLNNLEA